jgi:hypothetical protein
MQLSMSIETVAPEVFAAPLWTVTQSSASFASVKK